MTNELRRLSINLPTRDYEALDRVMSLARIHEKTDAVGTSLRLTARVLEELEKGKVLCLMDEVSSTTEKIIII